MKARFGRLAAFGAIVCFVLPLHTRAAGGEPPILKRLQDEYGDAVLLVEVGNAQGAGGKFNAVSSGTGFLVDVEHGYILTAEHVVHAARADKSLSVQVKGTADPGEPAVVQLSEHFLDETIGDLALLKLAAVGSLAGVARIDIRFDYPNIGERLYSLGYPKIDPKAGQVFTGDQGNVMRVEGDMILVDRPTYEGDSGSPLLDETGDAIGVCSKKEGLWSAVGEYSAMRRTGSVLVQIPLTQKIVDLDLKVRSGGINVPKLRAALVRNSRNPNNLELFRWAQSISENLGAYSSKRQLLNDSLVDALFERGLTDAVKMLEGIVSAENSGKAALSLARKVDALDQPIAALAYAQEAVNKFHQDNSVPLESEARILLSGIQMKAGNVVQAEASLSVVLSKIDSLSDLQKGQALALSGKIAVGKGDSLAAYKNYSNAVAYFVESKTYGSAALALHDVAYMKLKEGKVDEAQNDLDRAFDLYAKGQNRTGESDTLYTMAEIQGANGQSESRQRTLLRYLDLFPDGAHAGEAAAVLTDWKGETDLKEDSNQAIVERDRAIVERDRAIVQGDRQLGVRLEQDRGSLDAAKIAALYNFRTVLAGRVKAEVANGLVTLTGTVEDKDDRALAEDTVENLPGVVRVDNQIEIKPEIPKHSDEWIAMKIRGELLVKANVSTIATNVDVKDGVVTLTGSAKNEAQKDLAGIYAKDIDNVKSVRNEIVVTDLAANTVTAGEAIDDASITSQVKYSFQSHRSTSAHSTKVTTEDGVVRISGVAGSQAEKDLATKLAHDIRGVKSVVNDMTVKS